MADLSRPGRASGPTSEKVSGSPEAIYYKQPAPRYQCNRLTALGTSVAVTFRILSKMHRLTILLTVVIASTHAGVILMHPLGIEYAVPSGPLVRPHHAVESNAAQEALLPRELLKSRDFYDNPDIAAGLAKESWFTNKEMQVVEREAERIPREKIYQIVNGAGFLDS